MPLHAVPVLFVLSVAWRTSHAMPSYRGKKLRDWQNASSCEGRKGEEAGPMNDAPARIHEGTAGRAG